MGEHSTVTTGYSLALRARAAGTVNQLLQALLVPSPQPPDHQLEEQLITYGYLQTLAAPIWLSTERGQLQAIYVDPTTRRGRIEPIAAADLPSHWPLATISSGRLFNRGVEWRWQPDVAVAGTYALLGLSEDPAQLAQGTAQLAATDSAPAPAIEQRWCVTQSCLRLIGSLIQESGSSDEHTQQIAQQSWREVRNPNPLLYPVSHGSDRNRQPRLVVQIYAQPATGAIVHTRYSHFTTERVNVT